MISISTTENNDDRGHHFKLS